MAILVRHYLHTAPALDLDGLLEQYAEALWIEERKTTLMTNAMAKAMGGK
jgi:hypothetical protein